MAASVVLSGQTQARRFGDAGYGLGVPMRVGVLNIMDRQVMSMLIAPIDHDLRLSDRRLWGLSFALSYAVAGLRLARLANTWSRRNIIAAKNLARNFGRPSPGRHTGHHKSQEHRGTS